MDKLLLSSGVVWSLFSPATTVEEKSTAKEEDTEQTEEVQYL
jgi:hypothetical protein